MSKKLEIRIDDPCSQDWNKMSATTPDQQSRFCGSCAKVVTDFSFMTDQELLRWFAKPNAHTCGRFQPDQLNRVLVPASENKKMPNGFWRFLLAGFLFSAEARAQGSSNRPAMSWADGKSDAAARDTLPPEPVVGIIAYAPKTGKISTLPVTLRGQVITIGGGGNGISYCSVMIDEKHGFTSDSNGRFAIPRNVIEKNSTLTITAVGYETIVIDPNKVWRNAEEKIFPIKIKPLTMGGLVVVARVTKKQPSLLKPATAFVKDSLAYLGLVKPGLSVFPNPVVRGGSITLSMRLDQTGTYTAQLFNNAGAPVQTITIEADHSAKNAVMNIPVNCAAGVYFVRLSHPNMKKPYTQQVIVW